jgi:excisionase family DNA binding protein
VERLLTQKEVARQLGISGRTLERHRVTGTGPRWLRLGRLVRYRISDLEEWVESSVRRSTSDNAEAWLAALPDSKGEPEVRHHRVKS